MDLILVAEDTYLLTTFSRFEFNPHFVFKKLTDFLKFQFPLIENHILFIDIELVSEDSLEKFRQFLKIFSIKAILITDTFDVSKKVRDFATAHCWGVIHKHNLNLSLPEIVIEAQKNLQTFPQEIISLVTDDISKKNVEENTLVEKQARKFLTTESKLQYKITTLSSTVFELKKQVKQMRYLIICLITSCVTLLIAR